MGDDAENQVNIVKKWSTEHPIETRQSILLDRFPNARMDNLGILSICPKMVYDGFYCPINIKNANHECANCRREFWMHKA